MNITQINCNSKNYEKANKRNIKYIVLHYTANKNDTARNNAIYFKNNVVNASAHYFVDNREIIQSVSDNDVAWHCGGKAYKHKYCRNINSIGVEMCTSYDSGKYYIDLITLNNTIELVANLMKKYNIPIENVIRHYDVTGKKCPLPFINGTQDFNKLKEEIQREVEEITVKELKVKYNGNIHSLDSVNIDGYNYVQLRDILDMLKLNLEIKYNSNDKTVELK